MDAVYWARAFTQLVDERLTPSWSPPPLHVRVHHLPLGLYSGVVGSWPMPNFLRWLYGCIAGFNVDGRILLQKSIVVITV